jgi:hypothetical protein
VRLLPIESSVAKRFGGSGLYKRRLLAPIAQPEEPFPAATSLRRFI